MACGCSKKAGVTAQQRFEAKQAQQAASQIREVTRTVQSRETYRRVLAEVGKKK